jgi:hypothetical protein
VVAGINEALEEARYAEVELAEAEEAGGAA